MSAVRLFWNVNENRGDGADAHQVINSRFFVTRIGWDATGFENIGLKPCIEQ